MSDPTGDPIQEPAWRSYLIPSSDVRRTISELTAPVAVAVFERIVSGDAEVRLRQVSDRPQTFDLAHLRDLHGRLFARCTRSRGSCATWISPNPDRAVNLSCITGGSRPTPPQSPTS
jgi:hypothetical protein